MELIGYDGDGNNNNVEEDMALECHVFKKIII